MNVAAIINALKTSWPIQLAVLIFSVVVIFIPAPWQQRIGITELIAITRPYCFLAGLLAACLLLAHLSTLVVEQLNRKLKMRAWRRTLMQLSSDEKRTLKYYIYNDTKTRSFQIGNGVIGGLAANSILFRAANASTPGTMNFAHNIQPWAWSYLKMYPELLSELK